jgi:hypothetical protein
MLSLLAENLPIECSPGSLDITHSPKRLLGSPIVTTLLKSTICASPAHLSQVQDILVMSMRSEHTSAWIEKLLDPNDLLRKSKHCFSDEGYTDLLFQTCATRPWMSEYVQWLRTSMSSPQISRRWLSMSTRDNHRMSPFH